MGLVAAALLGGIQQFLQGLLADFCTTWLDRLLAIFAGAGQTQIYFALPLVRNLIAFTKVLAVEVIVVRIIWEIILYYLLMKAGEEIDPLALARRFMIGLVFIAITPWVAEQVLLFGNQAALQISSLAGQPDVHAAVREYFMGSSSLILMLLLSLVSLILLVVVAIQALCRSVECLFLAVVGPLLSVGIISQNLGTFAVWWRELIVLSLQHAAQMMSIAITCGLLVGGGPGTLGGGLMFVAGLYVSVKTPAILKEYSHQSGLGGAVSTASTSIAQALIFRSFGR